MGGLTLISVNEDILDCFSGLRVRQGDVMIFRALRSVLGEELMSYVCVRVWTTSKGDVNAE